MGRKYKISGDLEYLRNKPSRINFTRIAGPELHPIQMYDLVFDKIDLKIRNYEIKLV